jgi:hypothetical protein
MKKGLTFMFPVWTMLALSSAPDPAIWQSDSVPTAGDQKNNKTDVALTAQIRRALMDDRGLSIAAHNVRIITRNGEVTLRGHPTVQIGPYMLTLASNATGDSETVTVDSPEPAHKRARSISRS